MTPVILCATSCILEFTEGNHGPQETMECPEPENAKLHTSATQVMKRKTIVTNIEFVMYISWTMQMLSWSRRNELRPRSGDMAREIACSTH